MATLLDQPTFVGERVSLIPLDAAHEDALIAAALEDRLFERVWYTNVPGPTAMRAEIERRLAEQELGAMVPYSIVRSSDGAIVGQTAFYELRPELPKVKIGHTWMSASSQGSGINTEMKYLMLLHAFETLDVVAVGFDAHALNFQSRAAILKLGAKQDGVLRADRLRGGVLGDTVAFSIIAAEWPSVRQLLEHRIHRPTA